MSAVRVIRIIEYEFEDLDAYLKDASQWTLSYDYGNKKMKSATLNLDTIEWDKGIKRIK